MQFDLKCTEKYRDLDMFSQYLNFFKFKTSYAQKERKFSEWKQYFFRTVVFKLKVAILFGVAKNYLDVARWMDKL